MSQRAEEDARNLLVQFEKAVQHRNERGVTLVEREEEVCVFYERRNVQEQMIRDGEKVRLLFIAHILISDRCTIIITLTRVLLGTTHLRTLSHFWIV